MAQFGMLDTGDPNAYRYGLQSSFNVQPGKINNGALGSYNSNTGSFNGFSWDPQSPYQGLASDDPDVAQAKNVANEEQAGRRGENSGFSYSADDALLNQLKSRINAKNNLGGQIAGAQGKLNSQLGVDQYNANHALGEGLRNTRQAYAGRGLLYSGARQGAEQQLRGGIAGSLKGTMAADTSEYQSAVNKAKEQYAAVDLQTEQQNLGLASQALDISAQNQIARAQAFQQLGQGLGYAAGTVAGLGIYSNTTAKNPTAGWQPQQLQAPGLLQDANTDPFFGSGPRYGEGGGQMGWYSGDNYTGTYGGTPK